MIVYCVMPIDHWMGWQKPADLFRVSADECHEGHDPADWYRDWAKAKELAAELGWEGDIREGPFVTVIPTHPGDGCPPEVIIAWKQDNNGTTWVASPFELPWVAADCDGRVEG